MKRRNFIGSLAALMCGAVGCKCLTTSKIEPDPFIKIYTKRNETVYSNNYSFIQQENCVYVKTTVESTYRTWIPIDFKLNQKSKDDMLKEINKYNVKWDMFEIIADNGKSNLYAVSDGENKEKAWGV